MRCIFAEEIPQVEIRNGMAFIEPMDGHAAIATSVGNLQRFVASCNRALDIWHEGHGVIHLSR